MRGALSTDAPEMTQFNDLAGEIFLLTYSPETAN